jgi:hypothetical protein
MDFESSGFGCDSDGGCQRINRAIAVYDGHTHVYQYSPELAHKAQVIVKLHVEEGKLHPYAGLMLVNMIRRGDGD